MNADKCAVHLQPIDQICGIDGCCTIMCRGCFMAHQKQANHCTAIVLNQSSISFFISFSDFIIGQLDSLITIASSSGIANVFKIVGGIPNYWDSNSILAQIAKLAVAVMANYRTLILNNRNYVADNRNNYLGLLHPQFLKDIFTLITQRWLKSSQKICEQLRVGLLSSYPTRYVYKRIKFELNPSILAQIDQLKKDILALNADNIIKDYKEPSKLSDLEISKVESVIQKKMTSFSQQKKYPLPSTHVNSFYQILENSEANIQEESFDLAPVLDQHPIQQISPNFLSYEALEKQIEELLIENERLKQANFQLFHQNATLKEENRQLKARTPRSDLYLN